jgi:hypothetical protein
MALRKWRRLRFKAGAEDTSVAELINRWLVERLDAESVPDPKDTD